MDLSIILYTGIIILGTYGFLLFLWWWFKTKHASEVYVYIMILFGGVALDKFLPLLARIELVGGHHEDMMVILESRAWNLRSIPMLCALLLILSRMTWRIMRRNRRFNHQKMREQDSNADEMG